MTKEEIALAKKTGYVRNIANGNRVFIYAPPFDRSSDMVPCEGPTWTSPNTTKERLKEPVGTVPSPGDPNRLTLVIEAITKLDVARDYTQDGRPNAVALTKLLGWAARPVGLKERDVAWNIVQGKSSVEAYDPAMEATA